MIWNKPILTIYLFAIVFLCTLHGQAEAKNEKVCAADEVLSTDANGKIVCVMDQDTNAETECDPGEYLDGDGYCYPVVLPNQRCPIGKSMYGFDELGNILCDPGACPCVGVGPDPMYLGSNGTPDFGPTDWEDAGSANFVSNTCDRINNAQVPLFKQFTWQENRELPNSQILQLTVWANQESHQDGPGGSCRMRNTTKGDRVSINGLTPDEVRACILSFTNSTGGATQDDSANNCLHLPVVCGDGYLDEASGEECDDSNVVNGDGCSSICKNE
jgi:cysteine-rich repeat protein